jgi:ABC-type glycerol-3-phosphate transport system substrate-binding protein
MHDKNYGCVPAREDEAETVEFFQNEPWPTLFDAVDDGIRRLYHPNAGEVNNTMMEQLQSYWVGNKSASEALDTVAQQAQQG